MTMYAMPNMTAERTVKVRSGGLGETRGVTQRDVMMTGMVRLGLSGKAGV
jgi:hypothetical protein